MTDSDEVELSKLAKKMLVMPPKKRADLKLGKPRNPTHKQKEPEGEAAGKARADDEIEREARQ